VTSHPETSWQVTRCHHAEPAKGSWLVPSAFNLPFPVPPPPPPIFNPSTPYTVPNMRQTPVAPGLPNMLPDSSFCSTFDLGPCFPQFLPPIGQDLRLTIISTDDNDRQKKASDATDPNAEKAENLADKKPLNSISEMYAALRACWTPPPKDDGMGCNTLSVSASGAMARLLLPCAEPIRAGKHRTMCVTRTAAPSTQR
jgi:hypothetical protein